MPRNSGARFKLVSPGLVLTLTLFEFACSSAGIEPQVKTKSKPAEVVENETPEKTPTPEEENFNIPDQFEFSIVSAKSLKIVFPESMQEPTVEKPANYTLSTGEQVASAVISASDPRVVEITLDRALMPKKSKLIVQNTKSMSGKAFPSLNFAFRAQTNAVFVSRSSGSGNMSTWEKSGNLVGKAAADMVCNTEAKEAGLEGQFSAWLSTTMAPAKNDLLSSTGAWFTTGGTREVFSDNVTKLLDGKTRYPISYYADGEAAPADTVVYTSTYATGDPPMPVNGTLTCEDWTGANPGYSSMLGSSRAVGAYWTRMGSNMNCAGTAHLFCFQKGNGSASTAATITGKKVFTTSTLGNAAFGNWGEAGGKIGIEAADEICKARALVGGLTNPQNFIAWLSTSAINASERVTSMGPFVNTHGDLVAATVEEFTSGNHRTAVAYDESGLQVSTQVPFAYTGTAAGGLKDGVNQCQDWQDSSSASNVTIGRVGVADNRFSFYATYVGACGGLRHLVCLEN